MTEVTEGGLSLYEGHSRARRGRQGGGATQSSPHHLFGEVEVVHQDLLVLDLFVAWTRLVTYTEHLGLLHRVHVMALYDPHLIMGQIQGLG